MLKPRSIARVILGIAMLAISACAGTSAPITSLDSNELQDVRGVANDALIDALWYQRVADFRATLDPEVCDELIRRGVLTESELARAEGKRFEVGDHVSVPYIGWGEVMRSGVSDSGGPQYFFDAGGKTFVFDTDAEGRIESYELLDR